MSNPTGNTAVFDASFIEDIEKDEVERKESLTSFMDSMVRPERVVEEDELPPETDPSVSGEKNTKSGSADSDNGNEFNDDEPDENGKEKFNLFELLELDNVAEWVENGMMFSSIKAYDYFDDSKEIKRARDTIVATMAQPDLNEQQRTYLKDRYDELGKALEEREAGRAELKEESEFPEKLKAKFNQVFKKWFADKNLNVEMSAGWTLFWLFVGMLCYQAFIITKIRLGFRKV